MNVKFWGTRGSIPTPGPNTIKYGGNTSCVSVLVEEQPVTVGHVGIGKTGEMMDEVHYPPVKRLVILDGGSGLRELGMDIMKNMQFDENGVPVPLEMWIFFSHVHWDHIQGIPFFEPMFIKGNTIHLYGEKKVRVSLEETLKGQQQYPNFPISIEEISINGANMSFTDLHAGEKIHVGNSVTVHSTKLSHPDGVFCYKIEEAVEDGIKSLVYATDTEHRNVLDPRLLKITEDADVLIYDAQYTPDEYIGNVGMPKFDWGHSTYEFAVDTAITACVKCLFLFHHDPKHTDKDIDQIVEKAIKYAKKKKQKISEIWEEKIEFGKMFIMAAQEGLEFEI